MFCICYSVQEEEYKHDDLGFGSLKLEEPAPKVRDTSHHIASICMCCTSLIYFNIFESGCGSCTITWFQLKSDQLAFKHFKSMWNSRWWVISKSLSLKVMKLSKMCNLCIINDQFASIDPLSFIDIHGNLLES